jgi:hypothetical protein
LLNELLTLVNLVALVRDCLGWMEENFDVRFEGRIDIGSYNAPQMKTMTSVCNEKEWMAYVRVVMKLEIHGIELVATRVVGTLFMMKILGRRRCRHRLKSRSLNVQLCLLSCCKHLMMKGLQMSPPWK